MGASPSLERTATYCSPTSINAFKQKGTGATMLVRLFAKLQAEQEKSSADLRVRMAAEIGKRFSE